MSAHTQVKRVTTMDIRARKGGDPLVVLTAYDAPTAAILDRHVDILLVGDSVGNVVHGLDTTVGVTMEMMILHGQAVMRGSTRALVVVDMPFGSYEESPQQAFRNASRLMAETGCQAVKLETGAFAAETVAFLTGRGIPVMAHVGLRPQSMHILGGFKVQGRAKGERDQIVAEAMAMDAAGAFAMVVENVAEPTARGVTEAVGVPTVGIGASAACDGQVLVINDMLGLADWAPRFAKRYENFGQRVDAVARAYAADVKARRFPGPEHTYGPAKS